MTANDVDPVVRLFDDDDNTFCAPRLSVYFILSLAVVSSEYSMARR